MIRLRVTQAIVRLAGGVVVVPESEPVERIRQP